MTALALVLARAGGWPRMLLLAACTAVVSGLLLVVVSILRLPEHPTERLFDLVAEPGLRGGTAFAAALLILPPLLLLYQAVRLGTAVRERRLAALRVAGATPAEIRRLGAVEVGLPASAGAVLGVGVYLFLRASFGGARPEMLTPSTLLPAVRLVPTTVAPAWWQFLAVVVGVAALGAVVGARASRHLVVSPLGVTRRQVPPPPRPWGLLLLGVAVAGFGYVVSGHLEGIAEGVIFALIGLAVVALVSLAPWVAYRVGVFTHSRVGSPALLLASRRLVSEPRAVGRAAAATGGIALVAGGLGAPIADLAGQGGFEAFYVVSFLLVAAALMVALRW